MTCLPRPPHARGVATRVITTRIVCASLALIAALPASAAPPAAPSAAPPSATASVTSSASPPAAPRAGAAGVPDPLDPSARVPLLRHQSAFAGYRPLPETAVGSWKDANEAVARAGGWRAYAREGRP
jgi:hypothetical protein